MNDFLNSKLFQDLQQGVLPEVKVAIDDASLVKLFWSLFLAGTGIGLAFFILKKAFK